MKKVLSISLSLLIMLSATSFSHVTKAVAEDSKIVFTEKYLDEPETETRSVPIITPIDPGDGGGSLALDNDSNNVYIKSTSNIYLGKNSNGDLIGSTTAGYNRYKWQLIKNSDGTYYIVNADSKVENVWPYKFVLSCSSSGVISLEPYHGTDRDQKWNVNTTTVNNTVYYTIRSINGYYLNILSSGTVSATTATCLNSVVQCSNTNQMTDDTKEYIDKINNSGLITQMNCYAYALGVYHKYEPALVPKFIYQGRYIYDWAIDRLQMGEIAGSEYNYWSIFSNIQYYTTNSNGERSLNASGKTALRNLILDSVRDDLYEMYSYTGELLSTTNSAACFSDWRKIALVIDTKGITVDNDGNYEDGYDYHWYVQHDDGTWTHKPGLSEVTPYDENNQIITDPATAARGRYDYFAGYYMIRCDYVLNDALNGMHVTTYNNDESGDILAHAYSSATHVSTSYDKLFTGKIEYGTCDFWAPYFYYNGAFSTFVYDFYDTYTSVYILNIAANTITFYTISNQSFEELQSDCIEQYYTYESVTDSHVDSPDLPCDVDFYEFTVAQTGTYKIYTAYRSATEQLNTYGVLYHNNTVLYSNDDGDGNYGNNFCITAYLTAGETYRVSVKAYDQKDTGQYKLYVSYQG